MRVTIVREGCLGCGLCMGHCPAVFKLQQDGRCAVHTPPRDHAQWAAILRLEQLCPTRSLHIRRVPEPARDTPFL